MMLSRPISSRPPVIILGMHRSGTALVASFLSKLGLFQGNRIQQDHESVYFLRANDTLLQRVGASWDNPSVARAFLADEHARRLTARCLAADLTSARQWDFLGYREYWKSRLLSTFDRPWGWKDPRNIFTLPVWLDIFPNAKLIYVVRNGVDVAASLRTRERRELQRREKEFERKTLQWNRNSVLERASFKGSARCLTLRGAFTLWEEYVAEADDLLGRITNDRYLVRYESFLNDPIEHAKALAEFCSLPYASSEDLSGMSVRTDRGNAYRHDPELAKFYDANRTSRWMTHFGYARGAITEPLNSIRPRARLCCD